MASTPSSAEDDQDRRFLGRIESAVATVQAWDADASLLAECRSLIPLNDVCQNYKKDDDILYTGNALFLKYFTLWFKQEVMNWINQPPCEKCSGGDEMELRTTRGPETPEERQGEASRVEVYYCRTCQDTTTTFPRYSSVRKLLETRKGRCGEYANLFGLYCRAVGFEVRYCADFTDHVWVECLVDGDWIMADSCEGLIDKPSMYEDGWGKKLSYIVGVTTNSVMDVTPRYTRQWFSHDFQARRRAVCSSEEASQRIIKQCNETLQKTCPNSRREELNVRMEREQRMLSANQQATEWTDEEKHGQGRISGSLQWKLSRKEAGTVGEKEKDIPPSVQSWHVESFYPPCEEGVSISVTEMGIVVSGAKCSVVGSAISVVVIDEAYLGCILQSRGFHSWKDVSDFVQTLPAHRIAAIQGRAKESEEATGTYKELARLGGLVVPDGEEGLLYLGQVDALPAWAQCETYSESTAGIHVLVPVSYTKTAIRLRTERNTVPRRVAWRLPETIMPLQTQLMASEEQKRMAFLRFSEQRKGHSKQYIGYTIKPNSPVYLLDASAYPFSLSEGWNTFHLLPAPLVSEDDVGIVVVSNLSFQKLLCQTRR